MKKNKELIDENFDIKIQQNLFEQKTGKNFVDFYTKFNPKLNYFNYKLTMDKQEAEDVASEAFITALKKIDTYDSEKAEPSTWIFTISRNIIFQRKKLAKNFISLDQKLNDDGMSVKDFIADTSDSVSEHNNYINDKASVLVKYIPQLKEPYRTIIEMREIKRMSYEKIALDMKLNLSTCKSQIRNGRISLIRLVKKEMDKIDSMYI